MGFAAALSEHPITAHAVAEVAGAALEQVGAGPDLVLLFMTSHHAGALEDAAGAVRAILEPGVLLGCAAAAVIGIAREVDDGPGVGLWAGNTGRVVPVALDSQSVGEDEALVGGWPESLPFDPAALLLLGDPFSFPAGPFLEYLGAHYPDLPVLGGMASAARGPGGNRLLLDGAVRAEGAVGVFLGPTVSVEAVVSQGCRAIGPPLAVTRTDDNVIYELAGGPALERLQDLLNRGITPEDAHLIRATALHIGLLLDGPTAVPDREEFLIRKVLGGNSEHGAVIIDEALELGTVVQFHVRDDISADEELRDLLGQHMAESALIFTCNDRGMQLFGEPDHDATVVADAFGPIPTSGFAAAGEFGPVGRRNFLHNSTASIALFRT